MQLNHVILSSFSSRIVNVPGHVVGPFVIVTCCGSDYEQKDHPLLNFTMNRSEVKELISQLMELDENWPTEPPPEAPTAQTERSE